MFKTLFAALARVWALEPVRSRVYLALVPLVALLVTRGIITDNEAPILAGALAVLLGISGAETARSKVVPAVKLEPDDAPYAGPPLP